jgi:hypothetical protein
LQLSVDVEKMSQLSVLESANLTMLRVLGSLKLQEAMCGADDAAAKEAVAAKIRELLPVATEAASALAKRIVLTVNQDKVSYEEALREQIAEYAGCVAGCDAMS